MSAAQGKAAPCVPQQRGRDRARQLSQVAAHGSQHEVDGVSGQAVEEAAAHPAVALRQLTFVSIALRRLLRRFYVRVSLRWLVSEIKTIASPW